MNSVAVYSTVYQQRVISMTRNKSDYTEIVVDVSGNINPKY